MLAHDESAWSASCLSDFVPGQRTPGAPSIGVWLVHRGTLNTLWRGGNLLILPRIEQWFLSSTLSLATIPAALSWLLSWDLCVAWNILLCSNIHNVDKFKIFLFCWVAHETSGLGRRLSTLSCQYLGWLFCFWADRWAHQTHATESDKFLDLAHVFYCTDVRRRNMWHNFPQSVSLYHSTTNIGVHC